MKQGDCELFKLPVFQVGRFLFKFGYKTSDNQRHQGTCRADERDDVYRKLREIGIRPFCVECDDPDYAARKGAPAAAELTIAERLKRINGLKEQGLLTDEEYAAQRTKILSEL